MHVRSRSVLPCAPQGVYARAPALFRDTAMDTHKSSAQEDFGPRIVPEKKLGYTTRITSGGTPHKMVVVRAFVPLAHMCTCCLRARAHIAGGGRLRIREGRRRAC